MKQGLLLFMILLSASLCSQIPLDSTLSTMLYNDPPPQACPIKFHQKKYLGKKKAFQAFRDSARVLGRDSTLRTRGCYVLRFETRSSFSELFAVLLPELRHQKPGLISNVDWSYKKLKRFRNQPVKRFYTFLPHASYGGRYIVVEGPKSYSYMGNVTSYGYRTLWYYERVSE